MPFSENRGVVTVLQNAVAAAANGANLALVSGHGVLFEVSGTYTGLIVNFEGSTDAAVTWFPVTVLSMSIAAETVVIVSTPPNVGLYRLRDAGGLTHVRARVSATGTGTITVKAVEALY